MSFDNKSLLISGLIVGGLACIYVGNTELASAIFGGLVGYLSHGAVSGATGVSGIADSIDDGAVGNGDGASGDDE